MPDLPEKYLNALPLYDDCCTDGTASSTETDFTIKALIPCRLNVVPTHKVKDGTCKYLVFGQFEQSLSKEQPTYAFIRAANSGEVVTKIQHMLLAEIADLVQEYDDVEKESKDRGAKI